MPTGTNGSRPGAAASQWTVVFLSLAVAACGAVAATSACGGQATGAQSERAFDTQRAWKLLEEQVAIGPRPAGSPGAESTRLLIERELSAAGLQAQREPFTAQTPEGPIDMVNLWAEIPALADPERAPIVVLCSHYDTKRLPFVFVGANDGGSSTAVLLELARSLTAKPAKGVNYRVVFFDGEEALRDFWADPDNRYGSRHHVAELKRSGKLARVKFCVLIDLVGDRDLVLTRDENSGRELVDTFFDAARSGGLSRHVGGSKLPIKDDHQSFLEAGVESVDLIDFDYGPDNSWWHSAEDTLDKCAPESLEAIGRIVLLGLPRIESLATR
jgi:glutaminyl-peptide cyclotransferase